MTNQIVSINNEYIRYKNQIVYFHMISRYEIEGSYIKIFTNKQIFSFQMNAKMSNQLKEILVDKGYDT